MYRFIDHEKMDDVCVCIYIYIWLLDEHVWIVFLSIRMSFVYYIIIDR